MSHTNRDVTTNLVTAGAPSLESTHKYRLIISDEDSVELIIVAPSILGGGTRLAMTHVRGELTVANLVEHANAVHRAAYPDQYLPQEIQDLFEAPAV